MKNKTNSPGTEAGGAKSLYSRGARRYQPEMPSSANHLTPYPYPIPQARITSGMWDC